MLPGPEDLNRRTGHWQEDAYEKEIQTSLPLSSNGRQLSNNYFQGNPQFLFPGQIGKRIKNS